MALNEQVMEALRARRAALDAVLNEVDLDLVKAWVDAWDNLAPEFDRAFEQLLLQARDGKINPSTVARNARLAEALQMAGDALQELADRAGQSAAEAAGRAALAAAQSQIEAIRSQLPPEYLVGLNRDWLRVDPDALAFIVKRTSEQIHSSLIPLSDEAVASMRSSLVRGISVGENPRRIAADMVRRAERGFNGGLTRATNIARTEILDAHRAAAKAADNRATEVVKGWTWVATLDARTCPSCLGMHGSEFPPEESGPIDHQRGRCDRAPLTKSWKELGFDIEEPPSILPDAQEWYNGLTPDTQRNIMGPSRYEMLQNGSISFSDLSTRRSTDGWRDSMGVTSVRDLRNLGGQ